MLLLGAAESASAQVCKISDTNDNVEVFSAFLSSSDQVTVVVSNDSKDISANVTVKVNVTYGTPGLASAIVQEHTGKGLAKPNGSAEILIDIPEKVGNKVASAVQAISISGTKCLN